MKQTSVFGTVVAAFFVGVVSPQPSAAFNTCTLDPSRVIFAGVLRSAPCRLFDGDPANCALAYYDLGEMAVSCLYDVGNDTCEGTGGDENSIAFNTCTVPPACTYDPTRTNLIGEGNNGSAPCKTLTDMATCNAAYYLDGDDPVACAWNGSECDGCNGSDDGNSQCLKNTCQLDPAPPSCTLEPARTNYMGWRSEPNYRCSVIPDQATCDISYYSDEESGTPIACFWDGDCEGTGGDENDVNTCLEPAPPPPTCVEDVARTNYIGAGQNSSGPCNAITDMMVCNTSFYSDGSTPVACEWDGTTCDGCNQGNGQSSCQKNHCTLDPTPVTCVGDMTRTNFTGSRDNPGSRCRKIPDQATCDISYYDADGQPISCFWDAFDGRCEGRGFQNPFAGNTCDAVCLDDPSRTHIGTGANGSQPCPAIMDQMTCDSSFYTTSSGDAVACAWDGTTCDGCNGNFGNSDCVKDTCRLDPAPPTCTLEPMRVNYTGGRHEPGRRCRKITDQATCDISYYTDFDNNPISCYWDAGDGRCEGVGNENDVNTCLEVPPPPPTCTEDPTRTNFIGLGDNNSAPCNAITDMMVCNTSYYSDSGEPVGCQWDGSSCDGCNGGLNGNSQCVKDPCRLDPTPPTCTLEPARVNYTGTQDAPEHRCRIIADEATCDLSYYSDDDGDPIACYWDDVDDMRCEGTGGDENDVNTCLVVPPTCTADPTRTTLVQCNDLSDQASCESAFHLTGNDNFGNFGASCHWDGNDCFGCGYANQARAVCVNSCVTCGNGVLDAGEQCDDGNVFDDDCCSATCTIEPNGSACTDRDYCTVVDGTCNNGNCTPGGARDCSGADNPPCGVGVCDNADRECDGISLPHGTTCSDGNDCTTGDQCLNGNCSGAALDCSAFDDQCNVGTCSGGTCGAVPVGDGTGCDDGESCTTSDVCTGGVCDGTDEPDMTSCTAASGCQTGGMCSSGVCAGTSAAVDGTGCDDGLFCNGSDTCTAGACTTHAGNPCEGSDGDGDCSEQCDESANSCDGSDPAGALCDFGGNFCQGPFFCDGFGNCFNSDNRDCSSFDSACTEGVCDFGAGACTAVATNFAEPCDDGNACNTGEQCGASSCGGGTAVSCDDASNCTTDSCVPATGCAYTVAVQTGCRTAAKSKFQYKNNADDAKDQVKWKWGNGAATTQAEFGDPTTTADYELCVYGETVGTPTLLLGADIPASNTLWAPVGTKGYKYKDNGGTAAGITKAKLKGNDTDPKSKIILKGKGMNLDDITLPLDPMFTGIRVQLTNRDNGICFESDFPAANIDGDDQKVKAKTP